MDFDYFVIYKPYGIISQFSGDVGTTLAHLYDFPKDVYPVGRLDRDSEGLLLLTNDKSLNEKLLSPKNNHERTYWVQVEGAPNPEAIKKLAAGVTISTPEGPHNTLPCKALILKNTPELPPRNPPVRFRKTVPDHWIQITLTEGKNRQVRKMTAAVGLPTLRLVRVSIGKIGLDNMQPGDVLAFEKKTIMHLLFPQ